MKLSLSGLCVLLAACGGHIEGTPVDRSAASSEPVAASDSALPVGIWTMSVQYGQVDVPVTPGAALQVEVRANGTVYRWVCDGAESTPDSLAAPCDPSARIECLVTAADWTGSHWRMAISHPPVYAGQGELQLDSDGNLLIPYVNPTYSGALFRRVADADESEPGCTRY